MQYILFAILALVASIGNTIFNRLSSNNIGSFLSATLKSILITIACFIICLCFGNVGILYSLTGKQWLWVFVLAAITVIDWVFYFLALKRAHLEAFAPFCASGILFFSNLLFSIFMFNTVTSTGDAINIVFFYVGLAFLLGSMIYAVFNKKINPKTKKAWVLFGTISTLSLAFTLVVTKGKLADVPADVVAFHQMFMVFIMCSILLLVTKSFKGIKQIKRNDLLLFFIAAVFNALMMVFRYKALDYPTSNPAIINCIVGLDFVFVSIATVLFFKEKNKKQLLVLIILVVIGMILNVLSGLL